MTVNTPGRPDAIFLPASRRQGVRLYERVCSIADIAEPLLGADRSAGQRAYIRRMPHEQLYVTLAPTDTINYPTDHPRAGQPRYAWVNQPDGSRFGYLVDAAR